MNGTSSCGNLSEVEGLLMNSMTSEMKMTVIDRTWIDMRKMTEMKKKNLSENSCENNYVTFP